MLISIITINYNNASGLQQTLNSVISQKFEDFEYIVIDGGSTDSSVAIIEENKQAINYWISEKDNGIYEALNKGISKATGNYLMFLNSGDVLANDEMLNVCGKYIFESPGTDIFYGDMVKWDKNINKKWVYTHPEILDLIFFKQHNLNHQAALAKASLFTEFGLYPDEYKLAGDHWLYLNSFVKNKRFTHINLPMVVYDCTGLSETNRPLYEAEMHLIWESLVPQYVQDLASQMYHYKRETNYKLVKAALWINSIFQKIRN